LITTTLTNGSASVPWCEVDALTVNPIQFAVLSIQIRFGEE